MDATPADITDRGYLSATDLGAALLAATNNGPKSIRPRLLRPVLPGQPDTLYEVHEAAEVFVASPNYGWFVAAYHQYLPLFAPAASPGDMAQAIVDRYQRNLDDNHPNSIFWLRGDDVATIAERVSNLGDALLAATRAGDTQAIGRSVQNGQFADTNQCGRLKFELGPPDELIGPQHLCRQSANWLRRGRLARRPRGGCRSAGRARRRSQPRTHGQPVPRAAPPLGIHRHPDGARAAAAQFPCRGHLAHNALHRGYTARRHLVNRPVADGHRDESLAFVRDGRWDEFLREWYTTPLTPTVGTWCHYIPPQRFTLDDAEPLTLTVSLVEPPGDTPQLTLDWTATDDIEATDYHIFLRGPFDIGPTLQAVVPLDETSFTLAAPDAGEYEFAVLAPDATETFVAASNTVTYTVDVVEPARRILLPLVSRQ